MLALPKLLVRTSPVEVPALAVTLLVNAIVLGNQLNSDDVDLVLEDVHEFGHTKYSDRDAMPSGVTQEDTNQLNRNLALHHSAEFV